MFSNLLIVIAAAALGAAQSTTISLYIPGADTQPLVGSVVGSDATATTYVLQCVQGTDGNDCGFAGPFTLTEGPATAAYSISSGPSTALDFAGYFHCSLDSSSAVCAESFGGSQANDPGMSTETFTGTDYTYMPVVITAGALNTGSAASSNTGSGVPASNTGSGSSTTSSDGSKTSSGAAQTPGSSSTSTSTGGVPMITGAGWVVGGAALAAALI